MLSGADRPRRLHDALAPGSHLVFTHITQEPEPESGGDVGRVFKPAGDHFWGRCRAEIRDVVAAFDLVEPGLVYTPEWRPDGPVAVHPERTFTLAGVGRRR